MILTLLCCRFPGKFRRLGTLWNGKYVSMDKYFLDPKVRRRRFSSLKCGFVHNNLDRDDEATAVAQLQPAEQNQRIDVSCVSFSASILFFSDIKHSQKV